MLIQYKPIILCFAIGISKPSIRPIKEQLIKAALKLETDDRGYVYVPGEYKTYKKKGELIAKIANFTRDFPFQIEMATKQTINILAYEDTESKKYIILVVDIVDQTDVYGLEKCLTLDLRNDYNCHFIVCNLGDTDLLSQLSHPRYTYLKVSDLSTLGDQLIQIYYPKEERQAIDLEMKEKYGMTPAEAKQNIQEKYAQNISSQTNLSDNS